MILSVFAQIVQPNDLLAVPKAEAVHCANTGAK